eukprot:gb/GEZN01012678.1/.p1 GENE.gb/GEZN01012678.1/~~gb/GEZN01012678.1/.p1  ORF type:complete len:286 (+),score=19.96 gb/GEZN01012678.1/:60-917(+)
MSNRLSMFHNKLRYAFRASLEKLVLGAAVRDTPHFSYHDHVPHTWDPASSENSLQECPQLDGLFVARGFATRPQLAAMEQTVAECTSTSSQASRCSTHFRLHEFDPARYVAPCLPQSIDRERLHELARFEVFDGADPSTEWLQLGELVRLHPGAQVLQQLSEKAALSIASSCHRRGYESQYHLGERITTLQVVFLQLQEMKAGSRIMPHVDAAQPEADVVATLCVTGSSNMVRCGPVEFEVKPGDLYVLANRARWDVKHEVFGADQDRLSITIRYRTIPLANPTS